MTHGGPTVNRRHSGGQDDEEDQLPPPPDGGWGWVVVFASFMIHIITDGVTYSFGVFYNKFLDSFKEGKGVTSLIASILVGVTLCSGPITSSFVNRFGCRPVTIAGAILASACMALSVWAPNVATLCITIGLGTGFGFGLIYLPAIVSVTCYFEKRRSLATGIAVCGSGLGTFIFAPVTGWLIDTLDWKGAILVISALVLSCVLLGALFRPLEAPAAPTVPIEENKKYELVELVSPTKKMPDNSIPEVGAIHRPHSISNFTVPRTSRSHHHHHNHNHHQQQNGKVGPDITRLALSQPVLGASYTHLQLDSHKTSGSGIMYKKDIFYRGSLHNIPQNKSTSWLSQETKPTKQNGHIMPATEDEEEEEDETSEVSQMVKVCGCLPCSKETRDTLTEMLDFKLLKDPVFVVYTVSNFLTSIGFNMPYLYIVDQAAAHGIPEDTGNYILSVIGVANLIGRIILGYVSDKPWTNRLLVYNVCLTVCGLATTFSVFCNDFWSYAFYGSVFGFTIGAYVGLTSVILVDLLGLEKLTNAFGLLLLFQGIASIAGPPIGGALSDAFNSYNAAFYLAGVNIAASGLILFSIPYFQRKTSSQKVPRLIKV